MLLVAAQQDDKWNSGNLRYLTEDDIIGNPDKARQHWSGLSDEQKNLVYSRPDGIREFSDKFASEKGIKALDLRLGNADYDGINLVNGNTRIPVSALENAEVIALDGGGFRIKYPDGSDLVVSDFSAAGDDFIMVEGNNLDFGEFFYDGVLDVYGPSHYRMEPNSDYLDSNVEITTSDYPVGLYYGPQAISEQDYIQFDNKKISVEGKGIHVRFTDGNKFEDLVLDGEIAIEDGSVTIEFDGEGNAYEEIPLGEPETPLTIEDENAPDKKYVLDPGDEEIEDDGTLEGFGGCGLTQTGFAILDITGRGTREICKGPLVKLGEHTWDPWRYTPYPRTIKELYVNDEQLDTLNSKFIKDFGHPPDLDNEVEYRAYIRLLNEHVTDMKLKVTILADKSYDYNRVMSVIEDGMEKAGKPVTSLTIEQQQQIKDFVPLLMNLKKNDNFEYQLSGSQGLFIHKGRDGSTTEKFIDGSLMRILLQSNYDSRLSDDETEAKNLLKDSLTKAVKK